MDDCISRQAAIDAVMALDVSHRVSWMDAVIDVIDELPSAQPIDVHEAYYRGKIDGIKECTARLKKMKEELKNG